MWSRPTAGTADVSSQLHPDDAARAPGACPENVMVTRSVVAAHRVDQPWMRDLEPLQVHGSGDAGGGGAFAGAAFPVGEGRPQRPAQARQYG
jgi:hypothetical protein